MSLFMRGYYCAIILAFTGVKKAATGCREALRVINTAVFLRSR